jgi:glycosyltransferase involved in cell wall biosynthesis
MNILHITTSDRGGAGKACIRLHNELLKKDINSKVLSLDLFNSDAKEVYPFFNSQTKTDKAIALLKRHLKPALDSYKLKGKTTSYEIFSFPDSYIDITKHHLYNSADIIHLHFVSEFLDYKTFFERNDKPVVITLHDMNPFTGGCHYSSECQKFKNTCNDCPQLKGAKNPDIAQKYQKIKKNAFAKTQKIIAVSPSEWLKQNAETSKILLNAGHITINHGLDLSFYKPRNKEYSRDLFNIPKDAKVLLYIAEDFNRENKGIDSLLNSLKCVNDDFIFLTVGKGKKLNIDSIKHLHLGFITDELLLTQIYSMADLTVIPSVYESFSLTTLESLACGTPVIAYNNSGPGEIIKHNYTGMTSEVGDINDIAKNINFLLSDKIQLQEMSHSARIDVEKRFDASERTEDYINIYNHL